MPSLTIRLTPALLTALETTAAAQGTTRTALVTAALSQYLQLPPEPLEARLDAIESRLEALESSRKTTAPTRQDSPRDDGTTGAGRTLVTALIEAGAIAEGTARGSVDGIIKRLHGVSPGEFLESLGWTSIGSRTKRQWYPPEATTPAG